MNIRVPFLDLRVTDSAERSSMLRAIEPVLAEGPLILGPEVRKLEDWVASYCGRRFAVGVGSGTDALIVALLALRLQPGDEVITTPFTWIATANAIRIAGGVPVFADIDDSFNLDPTSVASLLSPRTRAILPVHLCGKIADVESLKHLAHSQGIPLIEDAAQAFGARRHGHIAGSFGEIACFSMNPMKVFAACGEAGVVVTDSPEIHERCLTLRDNGMKDKTLCVQHGLNARLDTMQAAILLHRSTTFTSVIERRRRNAHYYRERLAPLVRIPHEEPFEMSAWYSYVVRSPHRDALLDHLITDGIEAKIQPAGLIPLQPGYQGVGRGEHKNAELIARENLALPIHEKLSLEQLDHVVRSIESFFKSSS